MLMCNLQIEKTIIRAALTEKSADRLGLKKGKEVLILIKAPWVNIEKGTSLTAI